MILQGKGFFTFILPECEGGDPAKILAAAQAAGLSHVLVKIADGVKSFGVNSSGDFTAPVVQALRAAGIAVWGWHYVYGNNPSAEANIAIQRTQELGLDGYVVDAEEEYKQPGKQAAARQFMTAVRGALTVPIALSAYRFPNYHPELPWSTFLEFCDLHMPQVYWEQSHNAGSQLRESKRQCDALPNARPYIPTGAAYGTPPIWDPTPADITDFLTTAKALGLPAVNFFDWDYCKANLPQLWPVIANFSWPAPVQVTPAVTPVTPITTAPSSGTQPAASQPPVVTTPPVTTSVTPNGQTPLAPPDGYTGQYLAALNARKPAQAAALYQSEAVFVRADKVVRGAAAIQADYVAFFAGLPAGAFTLAKAEVDGDVRYVTWKLGALTGVATLVWNSGKISLHYIFIE